METKPSFSVGSIVEHGHYGKGRIVGYDGDFYVMHFKGDVRNVPFTYQELKAVDSFGDPEIERIKQAVSEVLGDYGWAETDLEVHKRWLGGTVTLTPGKEGAQHREIPIETFIKKIIGVREKLRVLEQKINNHPKLDSGDKLELQAYLTRSYGSLTTFNALFADKASHFVGSGGDS